MLKQAEKYVWMCKGCRSNGICCFQQYKPHVIEVCPCRECLIKGICIKACEPYQHKAHPLFNENDLMTLKEGAKIN